MVQDVARDVGAQIGLLGPILRIELLEERILIDRRRNIVPGQMIGIVDERRIGHRHRHRKNDGEGYEITRADREASRV